MGTFEIIKSFYISGAALWYGKNIQKHPKKSPLVPLQWQENNIWHSQVYFFSFLSTYKFSRNATRKKTQKFTTHEEILKALYIDRSFSFMWNSRLCHFPSLKGLQKSTVLKEPKDAFMNKLENYQALLWWIFQTAKVLREMATLSFSVSSHSNLLYWCPSRLRP